ncbi:HAD family hydrolase [Naumannella sp. ID2617S]|nr:HAD family hydrolase [Naumannella sp. ID2617S]
MTEPGPDARSGAAAFFDLDNTMVRGTSMIQLGKGLYARKYFRAGIILRALWLEAWFRATGAEHEGHIVEIRETVLSIIEGRTVQELAADSEQIFNDSIAGRLWPQATALADSHLSAGRPVWLVTAAPIEVARVCAKHLGLTGAIGTEAESVEGVYTGRLHGPLMHGPAKADAVRALALERGYDLSRCSAYSDSFNDLPMLSLVGDPHVVNPDGDLLRHARAANWPVHDFRGPGRRRTIVGAAVGGAVLGGLGVELVRRLGLAGRARADL